jgi:hypothetical protein
MAQSLRQLSIQGPGSQGLNSEVSPFQQTVEFALRADNAVIDRIGRIAAREAFADYIQENDFGVTGTDDFEIVRLEQIITDGTLSIDSAEYNVSEYNVAEWNGEALVGQLAGTSILAIAGVGNYRFTDFESYVGCTVKDGKLVRVPEIAPTYGVTNCQLVAFKDEIYVFSKGDAPMVWNGTTASKLSDHPDYIPPQDDTGIIANELNGDIACAAYGRLWVSGVGGDYDTIFWSDLLIPHQWYDGKASPDNAQNSAGIIDVREYWPTGNDKIQGIAAHNGFLIVFGNHSILIYSGAQGDPAGPEGLQLQDAIRDVGLVNQDAMCNVGTDHLFVDSLGVRALGRVIQEKSSPISEPSLNIATVIRPEIEISRDSVRMFHLPSKTLAVCLFPRQREAYAFQLGQPGVTGGLRCTRWTGCDFWDGITVLTDYRETEVLGGRDSRGILAYDGYKQPTKYTMSYESTVLLSGENLTQNLVPKSIVYSYHTEGGADVSAMYSRWGFGTEEMPYMAKVFTQPADNQFRSTKVNVNGSGDMLRVGFDVDIDGKPFAMQQISINTLIGRVFV